MKVEDHPIDFLEKTTLGVQDIQVHHGNFKRSIWKWNGKRFINRKLVETDVTGKNNC